MRKNASLVLAGLGLALIALSIFLYQRWEASGGALITPTPPSSAAVSSAQGFFRLSYRADAGEIPLNSLHTWTIHVEDSSGQPVTGAQIGVDGRMPAHSHGLPTQPEVTADLGGGDYRVEGLRFQMSGEWQVDFLIAAGGLTDTATVLFTLR